MGPGAPDNFIHRAAMRDAFRRLSIYVDSRS